MQNPPAPEPSSPNASGGYDAYPSAPSAGAPVPSYSQGYSQQVPAYSAQGQGYTPPAYDAQSQGYAPPSYGSAQQAPAYAQPQSEGAGFFKALFDLSFSSYITVTFAKVIYVVLLAVCVLAWLLFVVVGFSQDTIAGVLYLLFGWIPAVINMILVRLGLETSVALIRTAQNTSELVAQGKKG